MPKTGWGSWKFEGGHLDTCNYLAPYSAVTVEIRMPWITKSGNMWELVYKIDRKRKRYVYYRRQLIKKGYMEWI